MFGGALTAWVMTMSSVLAQAYPGGGTGPGEGGSEPPPDVLGTSFEPGAGSGNLAFTGAQILLLLVLAAVMIGLGVLVVRFSRRRRAAA